MKKAAKIISLNPEQYTNYSSKDLSKVNKPPDQISRVMSDYLVAVAEHQDQEAFAEIFNYYAPSVRLYLLRNGVDASKVDDIIQETFAAVWAKSSQYDCNRATASTWIFTIARNKRIDAFRRENRPEFNPNDPTFQPSFFESGEQAMTVQERAVTIRDALTQLSPEQREVLQFSLFEGQSYTTIAIRLGIPLGTVKSRARLAIGKLRLALGGQREDL